MVPDLDLLWCACYLMSLSKGERSGVKGQLSWWVIGERKRRGDLLYHLSPVVLAVRERTGAADGRLMEVRRSYGEADVESQHPTRSGVLPLVRPGS